jgi:peroxiredoxin
MWTSVLSLAAFPAAAQAPVHVRDQAAVVVGAPAPEFELPDLGGRVLAFGETPGRATVLIFWAFWCDTWKDALPHLRKLAEEREGFDFDLIAISVDGRRVDQFERLKGGETPFPVLLDVGGAVSSDYGIRHVPTAIVVDADGVVRLRKSGYPGNAVILSSLRSMAPGYRHIASGNGTGLVSRRARLGTASSPPPL